MQTYSLVTLVALVVSGQAARLGYIIGGDEAEVGGHPYICSVQYFGGHWCGCSIISDKWILTAAHCIYNYNLPTIIVGLHDQQRTKGKPVTHAAQRFVIHPQYGVGSGFSPNDVAVVELKTAIEFNDNVQPIEMADPYADYQGWTGTIAGWGETQPWSSGNAGNKQYLQEADVNIYKNNYCTDFWGSSFQSSMMVCIGVQYEKASCNGDSGGPLTVKVNDGSKEKRILVGITSWGVVGCHLYYPAVYVKVSNYRDWIYQQTGVWY